MAEIIGQVLGSIGTASPKLALFLFVICAIGEFGVSMPYLLETIWLLSGYQFSRSLLSPLGLFFLWFSAQLGRQLGAITLYYLSHLSTIPLIKFFQRHFAQRPAGKEAMPVKLARRLAQLTPVSVAFGRLIWLRIPLTLSLGAQKKKVMLILGVLFASLMWDGVYIFAGGIMGATARVEPASALLYFFIGLTLLYISSFIIKRLKRFYTAKKQAS